MTADTLHPLAADYLERLRRAGRGLPAGRLHELLAEIEAHLAEAIGPDASDARALTALEQLGEPEAIVAAESQDIDQFPARRGAREWAAILLLLFGGFLFGVGWFAGVALLWTSRAWTTRDKWIGTLVIPGGLATSALVGLVALGEPTKKRCYGVAGGPLHCTAVVSQSAHSNGPGIAAFTVLGLASIVTAIYLARRAA